MNDILVKMVNGGIEDFTYSQEDYGGCPTCNYGSRYIDEFTVHLTNFNIRVKVTYTKNTAKILPCFKI